MKESGFLHCEVDYFSCRRLKSLFGNRRRVSMRSASRVVLLG